MFEFLCFVFFIIGLITFSYFVYKGLKAIFLHIRNKYFKKD